MITGFSCCCTPNTAKPARVSFPHIKRVSPATISLSGFTFPLGNIKHYKQRTLVPATRSTASWNMYPRALLGFILGSSGSFLSLKDDLRIIVKSRNKIKWLQKQDYFEFGLPNTIREGRKRKMQFSAYCQKSTTIGK